LFLCHGNICRSPMAEFILKDMVNRADRIDPADFQIESAAVSREEIGNDIYPPVKQVLTLYGVPFERRGAWQMRKEDYARFDRIYVMDESNWRKAMAILGSDPEHKLRKLLQRDVADPWYTGEYESVYRDIVQGCHEIVAEFE